MWLVMGQWRKVIDKTSRFAAGDTPAGNQGYAYVLILKAFAFHGYTLARRTNVGMAHEGLDNYHIALDTYQRAHDYLRRFTPSSKYHTIQQWIGTILYRMCMLSLRLHHPLESLENFRWYKHFAENNLGNQFAVRERQTVYYWYWRTLSDIMRDKVEEASFHPESNSEKYSTNHHADGRDIRAKIDFYELKDELMEIQSQYESLLTATTKFPRAGSTNTRYYDLDKV
jgi:hypothetical protein